MARLGCKILASCLLLFELVLTLACTASFPIDNSQDKTALQSPANYTYEKINTYPHDRNAFTQGLVFDNGILFESTGRYAKSSLRKVDLTSGNVLQVHMLPDEYFGEGITILGDTIIQLTWRSQKGFVYDKNSFEVVREFTYKTEGWGITHDGKQLIMSDGSSLLYFMDADTFEITNHIQAHDENRPIENLNELEFIDGQIWANVWQTETIVVIDPRNGCVSGWIDLAGILPTQPDDEQVDVLNGIAYDISNGRIFVTGKLWPQLFEIGLTIAK
ncbi:glutaminyl-peptide cyclotransferase [Chloroflexota bacterium]